MTPKALVAISGGVDSAAAALLLKEQGYTVIGLHLLLFPLVADGSSAADDTPGAISPLTASRALCEAIGCELKVVDQSDLFRHAIVDNFITEYVSGRTPNPCVRCNPRVKWRALRQTAATAGCERIATGHYARVDRGPGERYRIRKGRDQTRDQSYTLWGLTQEDLSLTTWPLADKVKTEIRQLLADRGLGRFFQEESREVCFAPDGDYASFLRSQTGEPPPEALCPGDVVHQDGRVLGRHEGAAFFTIGQRRGLGIGYGTPLYVTRIDATRNRVIVGDETSLYRTRMLVDGVNWVAIESPREPMDVTVKIRYLHRPARARLTPLSEDTVRLEFAEKQRAITPGQSAVFYDDDVVLGGGVIH